MIAMVNRRVFLSGAGTAAAMAGGSTAGNSARPPRKVIVATVVQPFWVPYPGLRQRVDELTAIIDRMAEESKRQFGRGPDLAILPEAALTGEVGAAAISQAQPYSGLTADAFSNAARKHRTYVVVSTYLREAGTAERCSNAAVLVDRSGNVAGTYRKVHLVVSADGRSMEGGTTPGREAPVFDCDFGRLGIQICYDMEFDAGWRALAAKGAELIAWPTQSPQTTQPAARALEQRCYIVSSTWRNNASVFEPTGKIAAQTRTSGAVLVHELDLSYAILPWSSKLKNGRALKEKYGERIGFRYYEDEDCGLFWSNDRTTPVRTMIESLGLLEAEEDLARVRGCYRKAGVPGY